MRIIKTSTLKNHWQQPKYAKAEDQLKAWIREVESAQWSTPIDVKAKYPKASIVNGDRVVFDICGNKYRLIVAIRYDLKIVYVRFFGTHEEYDQVNASTV